MSSPPTDVSPATSFREDEVGSAALLALLTRLETSGYRFITGTPATHARVLANRGERPARTVRDVLGWSLPFTPDVLDPDLLALLQTAHAVRSHPDGLISTLRASTLSVPGQGERLVLHSAYPTEQEDAVFFGPDSTRFADLIATELGAVPHGGLIVDVGAGAGVGGLVAGALQPHARVRLTDINDRALALARINAAHIGVEVETVHARGLEGDDAPLDAVVINPPYIADEAGRAYRDGGDMHGGRLSLDLAVAAAERLASGGRLILYTGAAIVDGQDELEAALRPALTERGCTLRYRELDPDVFGEELERPAYRDVERIALVAAVADRRA